MNGRRRRRSYHIYGVLNLYHKHRWLFLLSALHLGDINHRVWWSRVRLARPGDGGRLAVSGAESGAARARVLGSHDSCSAQIAIGILRNLFMFNIYPELRHEKVWIR